jgi:hypothetical protein
MSCSTTEKENIGADIPPPLYQNSTAMASHDDNDDTKSTAVRVKGKYQQERSVVSGLRFIMLFSG